MSDRMVVHLVDATDADGNVTRELHVTGYAQELRDLARALYEAAAKGSVVQTFQHAGDLRLVLRRASR